MRLCKHEYDISRSLCPQCSIEAQEAGIERRIAEANRAGQAMGAAAERERIAAWLEDVLARGDMAEMSSMKPGLHQYVRNVAHLNANPYDQEPDGHVGAPALPEGARLEGVSPNVAVNLGNGQWVRVQEESFVLLTVDENTVVSDQAVQAAAYLRAVLSKEATPAPGPSSFGAKCQAEVSAWPAWKKNAADPPVETPAPEPRYVQELERRLRSLAEEAAEGEHPGVVRKGRVTLEWLEEGTPAPEPALPEFWEPDEPRDTEWAAARKTLCRAVYRKHEGIYCCTSVAAFPCPPQVAIWLLAQARDATTSDRERAALAIRGTPGSTEPTGQHEFARHGGRRGRTEGSTEP